jgi:hypothetical protein
MTNWTVSVIIICILLFAFIAWLEYRRHLPWRIFFSLIAVIALACIALPITYKSKSPVSEGGSAILLTEHYDAANIGRDGSKRIFTIDKNIKKEYPNATLLNDIQDVNAVKPAVKQLHIAGYGLDEVDLQQLNNLPVTFDSPREPAGVLSVTWPEQLKAGELLQLRGKFNNTLATPIKLLLKELNTPIDSAMIPAGKIADFDLTALPKITGRLVFNLLALDGRDTIENENVPVNIEATQPVKVLILSSSPDFENKFLKNWLGEIGYAVAMRTAISKDKISQDFVNSEKQPLDHLSTALLNKFDVVICDMATLTTLTRAENTAVRQQVNQNGLGLIVRTDSATKASSWPQNNFRVTSLVSKTQLTIPLIIQNPAIRTAPLNIDPVYINRSSTAQNLVYDVQDHILASTVLNGAGRIVFTTLHATYTWLLIGDQKDYTTLWSLLVSKAARRPPSMQTWTMVSAIPSVNEPVKLQLQSGSTPAQLYINHAIVSPSQNALIPYEWDLTYWPQHSGWQQAINGSHPPYWWYTYQKTDWIPLKNSKKIAETKKYAKNMSGALSVTKQIQNFKQIAVPKGYFYLILVAALTFLWVERKLAG